MVERVLTSQFEVETAQDGLEAIRRLRSSRFDVILLDLMMPGLSGFAVLEFLLKEQIEIIGRVVVMTSRRVGEESRICNHDFTARILHKPFKESELKTMVEKVIKGKADSR